MADVSVCVLTALIAKWRYYIEKSFTFAVRLIDQPINLNIYEKIWKDFDDCRSGNCFLQRIS